MTDVETLRAAAKILRKCWGKKAERVTPRVVLRAIADVADRLEDDQETAR